MVELTEEERENLRRKGYYDDDSTRDIFWIYGKPNKWLDSIPYILLILMFSVMGALGLTILYKFVLGIP